MLIRRLRIERYQGIERLEWKPGAGVNCLIGPADAGKTTILNAIAHLLTARSWATASEYDYFERKVELGYSIEAVLGALSDDFLRPLRDPPLQGWTGDEVVPLADEDGAEQVIVARVLGTSDLDVVHELLTDSGSTVPFASSARDRLLFSRISLEDVARNEMRMVRGSVLERRIGSSELRAPLARAVADASAALPLPGSVQSGIDALRADFQAAGLPQELLLGVVAQEGQSQLGLLGLMLGTVSSSAVPVFRAGSGTRRMALAVTTRLAAESDLILTVDEPELGLEPYRQRGLVRRFRNLAGTRGQVFMTSHSPAVLGALEAGELWRREQRVEPAPIARDLDALLRNDPEVFLCRLPVLCEGLTEAGFLEPLLLECARNAGGAPLDEQGIHLSPNEGQPAVLEKAKLLLDRGLSCGLFVDNEARDSGRRRVLAERPGCALGTWTDVRNIEEALAQHLPLPRLDDLVALAAELAGQAPEHYARSVANRAGAPAATSIRGIVDETSETTARNAVSRAMQDASWFKSISKARRLGERLLEWGVPEPINTTIGEFWNGLQRLMA